ncbi:MAG: allophanate hydrolase [Betaproteobacteria bacterium]
MPPATLSSLALPLLRAQYASGALTPVALAERLIAALAADDADVAWIARTPAADLLAQARAVQARGPQGLPLYGVPFAVKDNIDVAGMPTTAACPDFAFTPQASATVVQRLLDAGALLVGKTNLDQFATGLVGTRSSYGAVPNSFDPAYVSGGSSSGSASVVARGLVSFALGTDTAGSGRVPAGFNNLVGLKPTRGWLSTRGVLPACRTLDCVSIFATTVDDATAVLEVAGAFDAADPYSRAAPAPLPLAAPRRLGVPQAPEFFGDAQQARCFAAACERARALGLELVPLDFAPLHEAARLLYDGPWVAERHAAIRAFFDAQPQALDPTVRAVIGRAREFSATDAFAAQYRLAALARTADALWTQVDALVVPTAPTIYTIAQVQADPIALNSRLGHYTNFVNLLDMAALAVPDALRADGLPFGVTLIGPAWSDRALAALGARWQRAADLPLGATAHPQPAPPAARTVSAGAVLVAVVGAHLTGMPLNAQLTERGAVCVARTTTAPRYRLHALADTVPPKPGLQRVESGAAIEVEVWEMPLAHFGSFVAAVPPPLAIGSLELADGSWVKGFVCEPQALVAAPDISHYGGWRAYMAALTAPQVLFPSQGVHP